MVQRTLWGHTVDLEIPDDVFPSEERLKELDEIFDNPEHGYFPGTFQGKQIFYRKNLPKDGSSKPKGVIVYQHGIHGQSGHGMKCKDGRYTDVALRIREFTEAGFAVYAHDFLGHGFSEGTRFLIPSGDWKINRDDTVQFVNTVVMKEQADDVPLFLAGDSYGACVTIHAARWFQDHPEETPKSFHGILLNCPAIHGDLPPAPVVAVLRRLAVLFPSWTPFFMPHPISSERVWKEPEALEYFENLKDGLSLAGVPFCLGTALGLLEAIETVQAQAIPGFTIPFSINHGTEDYGVPISGSEYMMDKADTPAEDKALNKIEGAYHNLYTSEDAKDRMNLEMKWIKEQIEKQKQST
ncbi:Monoglyceride lipase [Seminavis robusta]|uniref:Monoglyceride lipase n=1 Tax=Seminavis robusta TaxID=568900 RepID=A0A9N8EX72_9STRA|nr:Monoglyceride lipase [Seminavis robusta]|eukprot:Sro1959_g307960.1 Monoglyceride lipase (353) ;mRNA; r:10207-11702